MLSMERELKMSVLVSLLLNYGLAVMFCKQPKFEFGDRIFSTFYRFQNNKKD